MLLDRSKFLSLTVAIAAATVACSSGNDTASTAGASEADVESHVAGGACGPRSIAKPGEGSMSPYSFEEGFCFDLARFEGAPDAEGFTSNFFDFVYDHCRAYSSQLQPAVAKEVQSCLAKADKARKHTASGDPAEEFNAGVMYDCGKNALWSICRDGIDGRVNAQKDASGQGRCDRITSAVKKRGDGRPASSILTECMAVLSGLKSPARAQIESCVTSDGWDLYTCVEGISSDFSNSAPEEPQPTPAQACVAPDGATAPAANACDAVLAKIKSEGEDVGANGFYVSHCANYLKNFQPAAAKATIDCLMDPARKASDDIYACGAVGLRHVCLDPAGSNATCKQIVDTVKKIDPKADDGGKLTRQCHSLLPGLTPAARQTVIQCVPGLAAEFGESLAQYTFYSCIEGLDP